MPMIRSVILSAILQKSEEQTGDRRSRMISMIFSISGCNQCFKQWARTLFIRHCCNIWVSYQLNWSLNHKLGLSAALTVAGIPTTKTAIRDLLLQTVTLSIEKTSVFSIDQKKSAQTETPKPSQRRYQHSPTMKTTPA